MRAADGKLNKNELKVAVAVWYTHVTEKKTQNQCEDDDAPSSGDDSAEASDSDEDFALEPWLCQSFGMLPEDAVLQVCEFLDCRALGRLDQACLFFHVPRPEYMHLSVTEE